MRVGLVSNNELCLPLLYYFVNNKVEVHLYFGQSNTFSSSSQYVEEFCNNLKIPLINETKTGQTFYTWLDSTQPEKVFILGHRKKIDLTKTEKAEIIYNIHFGKLPDYRGPSPEFWQLKRMEEKVGLCIHAITDQVDAGPVYWSREIQNEDHFTYTYLRHLFSNLVLEGINEVMKKGSDLIPEPQNEAKATWYPQPSLKEVLIDWNQMKAEEICALTKACNNWNGGAISLYNGMEAKIIDASHSNNTTTSNLSPGTILETMGMLRVSCIDNKQLDIHYMTIDSIPLPGRYAHQYGMLVGQKFTYPSD